MKIIQFTFRFIVLLLIASYGFGQDAGVKMYFDRPDKKSVLLNFKLVNNLIVIPIKINQSGILYFILDSGVNTAIITELSAEDSINLNLVRKQKIQGLGGGEPLEVYFSTENNFNFGDVISSNIDTYVIDDNIFHLSSKLGTKINGIIGYDVFNSFIVEIDYLKERIVLYNPDYYKKRKRRNQVVKPIILQNKKPFINAMIVQENDTKIPVKLLVDTGSSLALWLSVDTDDRLKLPEKYEESFLGKGLNGDIYGKQGRIKALYIDKFYLKKPTASYPDSKSVIKIVKQDGRNGSLGAEVLRRFRIIIDYHNKEMTFIPNHNIRDKFYYNMSGIDVSMPYPDYPLFVITNIKKGSPADLAGLHVNDQIISINSIGFSELTLNDINIFFQSHPGRKINIRVKRNEEIIKTSFVLKATL